jgi:hypothetical protein
VTLVVPAHGGIATTTIEASVSGTLSKLELAVHGTVKMPRATLATRGVTATLTDLVLPFAVHLANRDGTLAITEDEPLLVHVGSATLTAAGRSIAVAPTVLLEAGWPRWSAEIRWQGLDLAPAIDALSGGRVEGTGSLSGRLALAGVATEVSLVDGQAVARDGTLRLADAKVRAALAASVPAGKLGIQQRIGAALADLAYSRLAITLGSDPAVQLSIAGRGNRVDQELDLTVNLRSR